MPQLQADRSVELVFAADVAAEKRELGVQPLAVPTRPTLRFFWNASTRVTAVRSFRAP